jgi:hypothetical protein
MSSSPASCDLVQSYSAEKSRLYTDRLFMSTQLVPCGVIFGLIVYLFVTIHLSVPVILTTFSSVL